jgi:hypothetical protein
VTDLDNADDAISLARRAYRWRSYPDYGPDTLLVLAGLLDRVWELLWPTANVNRLSQVIANDSGNPAPLSVNDFASLVDRYACLARAAHRGRGRPPRKDDLALAYRFLADFWQEQEGSLNFTNNWMETRVGLAPISPAACFLYNALKDIAPERPRLAEELRDLMAVTVKQLPGQRRGRAG